MKIKRIQIGGFRGIPLVDPPNVDIDLAPEGDEPKDMLIFGPNAFGKSSIADALEWFFMGRTRWIEYFDDYTESDDVHLRVPDGGTAYIELVLSHNGTDHTVRKEIDKSGRMTSSNLGSIAQDVQEMSDEILVLDHDQFRKFVATAHKDRWTTFSSLIGYQVLDHFRSGLDSLSGRSLTDRLGLGALRTEIERRSSRWTDEINSTIRRFEFSVDSDRDHLSVLRDELVSQLEITLSSLDLSIPADTESVDEAFWENLRNEVQPSNTHTRALERIAELGRLTTALTPFEESFADEVDHLLSGVRELAQKKARFDKQVLADFYVKGLEVIAQEKAEPDQCPFCGTPYEWIRLQAEVEERLSMLDFAEITRQAIALRDQWHRLRPQVADKGRAVSDVNLPSVHEAFECIQDTRRIDTALELESFDAESVEQWAHSCMNFARQVSIRFDQVKAEYDKAEAAIQKDPAAQLLARTEELHALWKAWRDLSQEREEIESLERKQAVTQEIVDGIRDVARQFREELGDFSGRVVTLINADIQRYYDALHPYDRVRPFLEVSVVGNQRRVHLKCDYADFSSRGAASLLSESHRNSLGLAIMLAFRNYKRQVGSAADFVVLDDVTQSFDVDHRIHLLDLLEDPSCPEISNQQVILLTHDRTLADLVIRRGEMRPHSNWLRFDITHWQLEHMMIEPCQGDPLDRAREHIDQGDAIAAAIYARRALEQLYRKIVSKLHIRVEYKDKPWRYDLEDFRTCIQEEIEVVWENGDGFIDPTTTQFQRLFRAQRIFNLAVHTSVFLENPMALGDVRSAIDAIRGLRDILSCPHCNCNCMMHTIRRNSRGNIPLCRGCRQTLS